MNSAKEQIEMKPMSESEIINAKIILLTSKETPITAPSGYYRSMPLDQDTFYIQYNICQEVGVLPMDEFIKLVTDELNNNYYKKIIIVLRYNSCVNSGVFVPMIQALRELKHEQGFTIHSLIHKTFSSAIINSIQLKQSLGSILVGSQTGGNVNGYGEVKSFRLPNTPIEVQYSTKYFELIKGYEKDYLYPDIEVEQSFENRLNGVDSEVQTVLNLD